jgi:hypothetical protein
MTLTVVTGGAHYNPVVGLTKDFLVQDVLMHQSSTSDDEDEYASGVSGEGCDDEDYVASTRHKRILDRYSHSTEAEDIINSSGVGSSSTGLANVLTTHTGTATTTTGVQVDADDQTMRHDNCTGWYDKENNGVEEENPNRAPSPMRLALEARMQASAVAAVTPSPNSKKNSNPNTDTDNPSSELDHDYDSFLQRGHAYANKLEQQRLTAATTSNGNVHANSVRAAESFDTEHSGSSSGASTCTSHSHNSSHMSYITERSHEDSARDSVASDSVVSGRITFVGAMPHDHDSNANPTISMLSTKQADPSALPQAPAVSSTIQRPPRSPLQNMWYYMFATCSAPDTDNAVLLEDDDGSQEGGDNDGDSFYYADENDDEEEEDDDDDDDDESQSQYTRSSFVSAATGITNMSTQGCYRGGC